MSRGAVALWVETLRIERLRLRLRQVDVAQRMLVPTSQISSWENGVTQPGAARMVQWALALDYDIVMRKQVPPADE